MDDKCNEINSVYDRLGMLTALVPVSIFYNAPSNRPERTKEEKKLDLGINMRHILIFITHRYEIFQ